MTVRDVVSRWRAEQRRFERLGVLVDGAKLIGQLLDEIEGAAIAEGDEFLSLDKAATESGYSPHHLARLIREGRIPNAGRVHAPRIRGSDLPKKPPTLRSAPPMMHLLGVGPGQVARAIVAREEEAPR